MHILCTNWLGLPHPYFMLNETDRIHKKYKKNPNQVTPIAIKKSRKDEQLFSRFTANGGKC